MDFSGINITADVPWKDIQFQCVKCRKLFIGFPPDFESYMHEYFRHIENDDARVEPVCTDCFTEHFTQYEQTDLA